jgi:hypothetical protein
MIPLQYHSASRPDALARLGRKLSAWIWLACATIGLSSSMATWCFQSYVGRTLLSGIRYERWARVCIEGIPFACAILVAVLLLCFSVRMSMLGCQRLTLFFLLLQIAVAFAITFFWVAYNSFGAFN